jgi:hypothetical protein
VQQCIELSSQCVSLGCDTDWQVRFNAPISFQTPFATGGERPRFRLSYPALSTDRRTLVFTLPIAEVPPFTLLSAGAVVVSPAGNSATITLSTVTKPVSLPSVPAVTVSWGGSKLHS